MDLNWQRRLIAVGAALLAFVGAWSLATESYALTGLVLALTACAIACRMTGLSLDATIGGILLIGYLVGNRGFAQMSPPGLPLLPAELGIGIGVVCLALRSAIAKSLPIHRGGMDAALILWLAVGTIRFSADVRGNGLTAVRDFAMVYYALFYFLARDWAGTDTGRRYIWNCLYAGMAIMLPLWILFSYFPDFFTTYTMVRGIPLIFFKGDVTAALLAAGAVWMTLRTAAHGTWWNWLFTAGLTTQVAVSNSRAALLALALVGALAAALRHWRFLRVQATIGVAGLLLLAVGAAASPRPLHTTQLYQLYERVTSMFDVQGEANYLNEDLQDKPDNNRFRREWWRRVATETWVEGPILGLGFGADLAADFTREYFAGSNEEFSARSPHNFALTVFARMGLVGALSLLALLGAMARGTWLAGHRPNRDEALAPWFMAWTIFICACLGVVLEGPMGAVIFWSALGLAGVTARPAVTIENQENAPAAPALLPTASEPVSAAVIAPSPSFRASLSLPPRS